MVSAIVSVFFVDEDFSHDSLNESIECYHNELISAIDKAADECRNNGLYIKEVASDTSEQFIVELATTFLAIFVKYCQIRRAG